ncbi:dTDP-glucose 4,6-dehydratase [Streptantibioticus ferralitis]|uniref:dTDP-glucose 4,6-dehydratase n=1 Tax=Streptantibioticus ferralitis TaxID=236510 RepID=A0ABT5Z165_9ACTN|nr:dTDP-glucose 4,6-dehydratase [Streptantibioticus ferralitis]MDF2257439.1 dTDP-glucose 4,6-dehydratase [Streptantibioticus ferralitis]
MRILVTGGAGFIGSEFVRSLLASRDATTRGPRVTVLDVLTYSGVAANLDPVAMQPGYSFVHGDICDADLVDQVMPGHDAVVHFAAESHVDRSIVGAGPFAVTNVLGTQVLLEAARRHRIDRFVHVSTDEVYGSIARGSWAEDSPVDPNSPYAASKAGSDLMVLAYHRTHGMDTVVTRCSNNYGPYQFPEKLIPLFTTNLLDGRRVPLYGDGRNVREWLHVSDHCRGIGLVLRRGRAGQVYHIGGGAELTNNELTGLLLEATGTNWELVDRVADRKGHDLRYSLDTTRIAKELGYRPQIDFRQGLAATIAWYRANRAWWEPLKAKAAMLP